MSGCLKNSWSMAHLAVGSLEKCAACSMFQNKTGLSTTATTFDGPSPPTAESFLSLVAFGWLS